MPNEKRSVAAVEIGVNSLSYEDLPFPIVVYPQMYGTFIGFKKHENGNIYFCECSKRAILNAIRLRKSLRFLDNPSNWNLFSGEMPSEVVKYLIKRNIPLNLKQINNFRFKENLCHICNKIIPAYRYLNEIYGGVFVQNYGWYIRKQGFDYGINIHSDHSNYGMIKRLCPEEILNKMKIDPIESSKKLITMEIPKRLYKNKESFDRYEKAIKFQDSLRKSLNKQNRKVWNVLEDIVRIKTGYKKVGEGWTSETTLYYIIKKLFPTMDIIKHHHPYFLRGLELDIYIKDLRVGIEYQGMQHYKHVKHWGGEGALKELKIRDRKKKIYVKKLV